jgi:hypothetical protein
MWPELYTANEMAIAWDEIGDLSKYNSKAEIENVLNDTKNPNKRKTNDSLACYEFASAIEIGDVIIAKKGTKEYIGWGIVTSDYFYDETKLSYKSRRRVSWKNQGEWIDTNGKIVLKTLTNITKYPDYVDLLSKLLNIQPMNDSKRTSPLNQILYGPPGTGKTYNTVDEALKIVDQVFYENNKDERDNLMKKFKSLIFDEKENPEGQIIFTTFHQSMSYEDFIEGIKPTMNLDEVSYEIKDGIFKIIADKAKNSRKTNFHESYTNFIKSINENSNDFVILKTVRGNEYRVNVNSNNNLNLFTSSEIKKQGTLSKKKLESFCKGETNVFEGWEGYAAGVINHLKEKFQLVNEEVNHFKNYVLVIDEINRGNVSAVFGELITLIEHDKRIGGDNELTVTLPYSKDKFGVPSNLYIIGTMNTADRSIEALDTALRRRFSFVEMLPDSSKLEGKKIEGVDLSMKQLLEIMNERIEVLVDRDHTIGHAFLIDINSIDELRNAFANKIIPLLQEYFYGNYRKMAMVIGSAFFKITEASNVKFAVQSADFDADGKMYQILNISDKTIMSDEAFIQALQKLISPK